jgi:hypothetical protein
MKKVQKAKRPRRPSKNEQEKLRATVEDEARKFLDDFHAQARVQRWQEAIPIPS